MKNLLCLLGMIIAYISTSCNTTHKIDDSNIHYFDEPDIDPHYCSAEPDVKTTYIDFHEQDIVVTFDKNPEEEDGFWLSSYYRDATTKDLIFNTEYRGKDYASGLTFPFEQELGWCKVSHLDECTFIFHLSENNMEYIREVHLTYCLYGKDIEVIQYPQGVTLPEQ